MIVAKDISVPLESSLALSRVLSVSAKLGKGDRPADVIFIFGKHEHSEKDFAELIFDVERGGMVPSIEIVKWSSLLVVAGIRRWIVFSDDGAQLCARIELFRNSDDDSGFYQTNFQGCEKMLVGVYEGGVAGISDDGLMSWHVEKKWDDLLLSTDGGRLTFLMEGGGRYEIDCSTGERKP